MAPDLWLLIQSALAAWVVWETLRALAGQWIPARIHAFAVVALAAGALALPEIVRHVLVIAALVAVLRAVLTNHQLSAVRIPPRR